MKNINSILRSSDPLDMPAGQIDTSFPRLQPERVYKMVIRSPEKKRNSKDTADMLVFKLETTEDALDTDGNKLYKGFKFTHRINGASGDRDLAAVAKDTATLIQAYEDVNATTKPSEVWNNPTILDGKLVWVKVGISPAKDGFAESNKVSAFIPPSKIK